MRAKTIDMRRADGYTVTEFSLIKTALKKSKKYRKDLLYRGFNGDFIPKLLEEGQDSADEYVYCYTEEEVDGSGYDPNLFDYASKSDNPAIAVFNSKLLIEDIPNGYTFKNPNKKLEALVAVYKLKNLVHFLDF
jgi:hypothetical protein